MLADQFGRTIDYLRISVTDRCDLRCLYCLPKGFKGFQVPEHWLSFAEITRVAAAFARLGTRRLRLTGGEPLLRRHLPELVADLAALPGIEDLSLSTNATQLAPQAGALRRAGLKRLNVSLDSLRPDCLAEITGSPCLDQVLDGLRAARAAGFQRIKINMMPMAGLNDRDVGDMVAFCMDQGFVLRLIEAMPMGSTGRQARGADLQAILKELQGRFALEPQALDLGGGPARYWSTPDRSFTLGLITPLSQHFCATCNRVRLAVDGTLYLCLGQEQSFPLRPLLRDGCSDQELETAIRRAVDLKPEKHDFCEAPGKIVRFMSATGG